LFIGPRRDNPETARNHYDKEARHDEREHENANDDE
jgi:hypothetical protein